MPGAMDIAYGNEKQSTICYLSAVTYPTLGANASSTTTVTLQGVLALDMISWNVQSIPAHLTVDNIYVSAANTLSITWGTDATGITGATVPILFEVTRATNANLGSSALPAAIV